MTGVKMKIPTVSTVLTHKAVWPAEQHERTGDKQKTNALAAASFQNREDPSSTDVSLSNQAIVQWQEQTGLNFDVRLSLERHQELYEAVGKYYPADVIAVLGGLEAVHALPILTPPQEKVYRGPINSNDKNKVKLELNASDLPEGTEIMRGFDGNGFPFIATCILRNANSRAIIPAHVITVFQKLEIEEASWIVLSTRDVTAKKDTQPYFDICDEGEGVLNSAAAQIQVDKFVQIITKIKQNKQVFDRQPALLPLPQPKPKKLICEIL